MRTFALLLSVVVASVSGAQSPPSDTAPARDTASSPQTSPQLPVLGRNTGIVLAATAGTGLAVALFDSRLVAGTSHWGDPAGLGRTAGIGNFIGGPVPISLGTALYALGRTTGSNAITSTGREVVRAVLVSGALTATAKGIVGRKRPFTSPGDADQFDPGRGFTSAAFASFPSGHTSAAFATATVLARELNKDHPRARYIVDPLLFGGATLVGFSRIYQHQHWPSDVIAGAALGTVTGFETVAHARGDRSALWSRLSRHLSVTPNRHGATIAWTQR